MTKAKVGPKRRAANAATKNPGAIAGIGTAIAGLALIPPFAPYAAWIYAASAIVGAIAPLAAGHFAAKNGRAEDHRAD